MNLGHSQTPRIRRATTSDGPLVQQINAEAYTAAYLPLFGAIPKPATEDYRPRIDRKEVWLLEIRGEPIGVLVIEKKPDHLLIYSIAIEPKHQGRGYGAALLRFAEAHALAIGCPTLRLFTNQRMTRNIALYRRCGFSQIGTRPHPSRPGEVLIDMEKTILTRSR